MGGILLPQTCELVQFVTEGTSSKLCLYWRNSNSAFLAKGKSVRSRPSNEEEVVLNLRRALAAVLSSGGAPLVKEEASANSGMTVLRWTRRGSLLRPLLITSDSAAWKKQCWQKLAGCSGNRAVFAFSKPYGSRVDWRDLRPMILKRIKEREKYYPIKEFVPVAQEVLNSRMHLFEGVSKLIQVIPVLACKVCSEVYIGEAGHLIQTCQGYRRRSKNRVHEWVPGSLKDIIVPVETYHLKSMFQEVIRHDQRFDFNRVPAVAELCWQAGADLREYHKSVTMVDSENILGGVDSSKPLSRQELMLIANNTMKAWQTVRWGVRKLLMVYPARVCCHCKEVHVGPSGHKARLCGVFKYETWHGSHFWRKAKVDDLVPQQIVWRRRSQDPLVLLNEGKGFYGHAPAIVDLCSKAGAPVPREYNTMMKEYGLTAVTES